MRGVNVAGARCGSPVPEQSKAAKFPAAGGMAELAALFGFGTEVPPFDTPLFSKRLGELVDQATRSPRKRARRAKPPKRN